MKRTGIIAFCGSKGAGKNTSSDVFVKESGFDTEEIALAGHLKEVCSRVFLIDMKYFTDPKLKEVELENYIVLSAKQLKAVLTEFDVVENIESFIRSHIGKILKTPRELLQYIGTEVLHPVDALIHVKKAIKKKNPDKLTIITDLRFVSEFEYFRESLQDRFIPVYIKNSRAEAAAANDTHPSEKQLQLFRNKCYLLNNDGSLEQLRENVSNLIINVYK